jgi:hypothetical protein
VPLGIRYATAKKICPRSETLLRLIWLITVLGIFVSMLIKLLPWFWQQNLTDQMLMLPIALTLALNPHCGPGVNSGGEQRRRLFRFTPNRGFEKSFKEKSD